MSLLSGRLGSGNRLKEVVRMAERIYELKLSGIPVPDGEIDVRDLVVIVESLRLAALRSCGARSFVLR